jgi:type IV pilus assembly protein PilN
MIRVNLLPQKQQASSSDGNSLQTAVLVVFMLELAALFFVQRAKERELEGVRAESAAVRGQIDQIGREIANHKAIQEQLKALRDRETAIEKLQTGRIGPTAVLLELSRVLTADKGPSVDRARLEQLRRDSPQLVPNPSWDSRRLWLTAYTEKDRVTTIGGFARDGEDVSELLRRLSLSQYFEDVKLLPAEKVLDPQTREQLVRFQFSAKVKF